MDAALLDLLKLVIHELEGVQLPKIHVVKYEEMEKDITLIVLIETTETTLMEMDEAHCELLSQNGNAQEEIQSKKMYELRLLIKEQLPWVKQYLELLVLHLQLFHSEIYPHHQVYGSQ